MLMANTAYNFILYWLKNYIIDQKVGSGLVPELILISYIMINGVDRTVGSV